ncbi:MAG: c-type cytochrome [Pirellulales bacterium]|nr:c-type cytochrome [Pirellulales bacterium]
MYASLRALCCACAVRISVAALMLLVSAGTAQSLEFANADEERAALRRGQELFERTWKVERRGDGQGDGLGPLFNERSCVACHMQGGIGGAGPLSKNVDVLSVITKAERRGPSARRLATLHPGFASGSPTVLHRFNRASPGYDAARGKLLGIKMLPEGDHLYAQLPIEEGRDQRVMEPYRNLKYGDIKLLWTARNTTPLFGAGLIELIQPSVLEQVAAQQTREDPEVTGRLYGRFGWRGQMKTLGSFVRGACEAEMGLTPEPSPAVNNAAAGGALVNEAVQVGPPPRFDISDDECNAMTAFVASLPAPRRVEPTDAEEQLRVKHGEAVFAKIGCAVCHRPTLASVSGIYSDLLLHDMGLSLADPLASPQPDPPQIQDPPVRTVPGYYGSIATPTTRQPSPGEMQVFRQEWKTPPLWGVRDSGPYLHDGRASTIEEAVGWHGGEALRSARKFANMSKSDRADVLAFLMTLAAPCPADLPPRIALDESAGAEMTDEKPWPRPAEVVHYQAGKP